MAATVPPNAPVAPGPPAERAAREIERLVRRRRRRRTAGAAAAVALALVVALFVVLPILPGRTVPLTGLSYSGAEPIAESAVPAGFGTVPTVLGAVGFESRAGTVVSAAALANYSTVNCTVQPLAGYPSNGSLYVPAFPDGFDTGYAPFWGFVFEASAAGPFALVAVVNGSASPLAELSGTNCAATLPGAQPLPPKVADSPAAASTAWSSKGSAWVAANPKVSTVTMTAYGGAASGFYTTPSWVFLYSTCSPVTGGTTSTPALVVGVGLTSASFLFYLVTSLGCPA